MGNDAVSPFRDAASGLADRIRSDGPTREPPAAPEPSPEVPVADVRRTFDGWRPALPSPHRAE